MAQKFVKLLASDGSEYYQPLADYGDNVHAMIVADGGNITGKFREAFESYDPVNGDRWMESKAAGDLVFVDGNAAAASYLVISKDPLTAGTETIVELRPEQYFRMPTEIAFGAHMSQRTLGQEFSVEAVDTGTPLADVPDLAISAISQAASVLTIDFAAPHGLVVGKSIGVYGCSDPRANYPALVVASAPTPTQITCTAGPGGTIPSLTIANPAGAKGFVHFRERLGRANNGMAQIFENSTVTNASLYVRSESGDVLPSGTVAGNHSTTIATTTSTQLVNSAYMYAFAPTSEFRLLLQSDRMQWADSPVDHATQMTSRLVRTQVCPDPDDIYKLRFRATNNKGLTVPTAQIVTATKAGTTTANIVTDRPHGLAVGDPVVQYGTRAQGATEFPNLLVATSVASIVSPTEYTIVQGSTGTSLSYGGYVAKVQGGNLMSALGANAVVAQNATLSTLSDGTRQLVLTGNTTWAGVLIGDLVELVGVRANLTGISLGIDGPWKVANFSTTTLVLVLPYADQRVIPADFTVTDCGGGVIRRTCLRMSFIRVFDYERLRVEALARPAGDSAAAMPVVVQGGTAAASQSGTWTVGAAGTTAQDSSSPNPIAIGGRAANANQSAMSAAGDLVHTMHTMIGAVVQKPYAIPEAEWSFTGALTTTSDVVVQAAAGAGLKRHVTLMQITNTGSSAGSSVDVILKDGATVRMQVAAFGHESVVIPLPTGIPVTANTALNIALSAAGTVRVNLLGYTAP
jgi:hypothetical protein